MSCFGNEVRCQRIVTPTLQYTLCVPCSTYSSRNDESSSNVRYKNFSCILAVRFIEMNVYIIKIKKKAKALMCLKTILAIEAMDPEFQLTVNSLKFVNQIAK